MNILELCLSPGLGGLELYVYRASTALSKNHTVVAAVKRNGKLKQYFDSHSSITTLELNRFSTYLPFCNAYKLACFIDDNKIDAIHMHWGRDFTLAAIAKTLSSRKPALIYTRQMEITRAKDDSYHKYIYNQMDLMLTITKKLEQAAKTFIPYAADRIDTLYYGVKPPEHFLNATEIAELREQHGFVQDDFIVGLFGRLEKPKGQHLLIKAIALAKQDNINLKAMIVGHEMSAGYRDELKTLAAEQDIDDNIVFVDFVPDPQILMQCCDCVVLATYAETFGLVLPEAMAAGVAVIGSNKGGVPEIISHSENGLMFESKDVSSLYQAILTLYNDPALLKTLAQNGQQKAQTVFSDSNHNELLEAHFIKCCHK